ncbi:uncharacterized protein LOC129309022 [Prosopis cineraria]|uniref:uncharacterized protein LOC129309022 n=1 Tax=Prosopis cineraria TaxID=364024 RepID=UPI0024106843|nr:uncharacterized protein LOC129309022 [Prosopis cineraria]
MQQTVRQTNPSSARGIEGAHGAEIIEGRVAVPLSTKTIPTSFLLPSQWPHPHNEELLLAIEESDFEEKCNEISKMSSNLIVIGKTSTGNEKEDFDNDGEDDDVDDNAGESEGEEFEQETG